MGWYACEPLPIRTGHFRRVAGAPTFADRGAAAARTGPYRTRSTKKLKCAPADRIRLQHAWRVLSILERRILLNAIDDTVRLRVLVTEHVMHARCPYGGEPGWP